MGKCVSKPHKEPLEDGSSTPLPQGKENITVAAKEKKAYNQILYEWTQHGLKNKVSKRIMDNMMKPNVSQNGKEMFGNYEDKEILTNKKPYELSRIPLDSVGNSKQLFNYILPKMMGLKQLIIYDWDLTDFPTFLPNSLEILRITKNKLTRITDTISLPELVELDLNSNMIEDQATTTSDDLQENRAVSDSIKDCHNLKILNLSRNKISSFPIGFFFSFSDLEIADLSINKIEEIEMSLSCNTKLKVLRLTANRITKLDTRFWEEENHSLLKLSVNSNPITLDPNMKLGNLKALKLLDIRSTKIKVIPRDIINCSNLNHIAVEDVFLTEPPLSVAEQDINAIRQYYYNFAEQEDETKVSQFPSMKTQGQTLGGPNAPSMGAFLKEQLGIVQEGHDELKMGLTPAEQYAVQTLEKIYDDWAAQVQKNLEKDKRFITNASEEQKRKAADPNDLNEKLIDFGRRNMENTKQLREDAATEVKRAEQEQEALLEEIKLANPQLNICLKELIQEIPVEERLLITIQSLISTFSEYIDLKESIEIQTSTSYYITRIAPYNGAINCLKLAGWVLQDQPFKGLHFFLKKSNEGFKRVRAILSNLNKYANHIQQDIYKRLTNRNSQMAYDNPIWNSRSYQRRFKSITPDIFNEKFKPRELKINTTVREKIEVPNMTELEMPKVSAKIRQHVELQRYLARDSIESVMTPDIDTRLSSFLQPTQTYRRTVMAGQDSVYVKFRSSSGFQLPDLPASEQISFYEKPQLSQLARLSYQHNQKKKNSKLKRFRNVQARYIKSTNNSVTQSRMGCRSVNLSTLSSPDRAKKSQHVIWVKDGTNWTKPQADYITINIAELRNQFLTVSHRDSNSKLKARFMETLLERVNAHFKEEFNFIYQISGTPVEAPEDIVSGIKVLVFSDKPVFKGYRKVRTKFSLY